MDINKLIPQIPAIYRDEQFLQTIEDHLPYLRTLPGTRMVTVSDHDCHVYAGDFHGLLKANGVTFSLLQIVTRFNGYKSSLDFNDFIPYFLLPDIGMIETIKSLYMTR